MISSLTNQGKLRFMIYEGAIKAPIFLNFLQRLVREAARKLFVIVDNLPVHRAHRVTAWVQDHADQIELFDPPSYAPEHNPDEFLNNDLKQAMARAGRTPRDKAALKSGLISEHAQPATLSRQGACLLSGPYRPICRVKLQCYVFAARVSNILDHCTGSLSASCCMARPTQRCRHDPLAASWPRRRSGDRAGAGRVCRLPTLRLELRQPGPADRVDYLAFIAGPAACP